MFCPYRPQGAINCEDAPRKCEGCGWHPKEEARRKEVILYYLKRGSYHGQKTKAANI